MIYLFIAIEFAFHFKIMIVPILDSESRDDVISKGICRLLEAKKEAQLLK